MIFYARYWNMQEYLGELENGRLWERALILKRVPFKILYFFSCSFNLNCHHFHSKEKRVSSGFFAVAAELRHSHRPAAARGCTWGWEAVCLAHLLLLRPVLSGWGLLSLHGLRSATPRWLRVLPGPFVSSASVRFSCVAWHAAWHGSCV